MLDVLYKGRHFDGVSSVVEIHFAIPILSSVMLVHYRPCSFLGALCVVSKVASGTDHGVVEFCDSAQIIETKVAYKVTTAILLLDKGWSRLPATVASALEIRPKAYCQGLVELQYPIFTFPREVLLVCAVVAEDP